MRLEVAQRSADLIAAGVPHVRATVVRAEHPTSVHAGDAAVVHVDGRIEGFVGGTCAESSVQVHARAALSSGEPLLLRILPGVEATTTEHGAVTVSNPCLSGGAVEIFLEPLAPPARLVVVGDTPTARALETLRGPRAGLPRQRRARDAAARGVARPSFVKPGTGHPAFGRACHLFGVELRRAPVHPDTTTVDVSAMTDLVDGDTGPSLSRYLERRATAEQFREFVMHRSVYHLKEADPHTWGIPRLAGRAKAALLLAAAVVMV